VRDASSHYGPEDAGSGQRGICVHCLKGPTQEGHDGCLGTLPAPVMNACCGHGKARLAYIQYWAEDGTGGKRISGDEAIREQARLKKGSQ